MKSFGTRVLLSLAVIAVAFQTRANANPPISSSQKSSDSDACDVYSAVLPLDEWYRQSSKTLLIVQEIPPSEWPIGSPKGAHRGTAEFSKAFGSIFKSFEAANKQEALSDCDFIQTRPSHLYKSNTGAATRAAVLDTSFLKNVMDSGLSASPMGSYLR